MDLTKEQHEIIYKIIICGESQTGKTNLMRRFATNTLPKNNVPTIGVEYFLKRIESSDGKTIKLQIWDTAGQERYRNIVLMHFRKANGAIIVFDVTNEKSFEKVQEFVQYVRQNAAPDAAILLLGNKIDKVKDNNELMLIFNYYNSRKVSKEEAEQLAKQFRAFYEEVSVIDNINVHESIDKLVQGINTSHKQNLEILLIDQNNNEVLQKE